MQRVLYSAFDVFPSPKGASTHIMYFLRGLVNGGYSVHLMTPSDGILPENETFEGATVTRVPMDNQATYLARAIAYGDCVLQQASRMPYDVVHYRSLWSGFPLVHNKTKQGYRTLFEVNGLPSIELKYHYPALKENDLMKKIREQEMATLMMSDAVICPSEVTRNFLTSLGVSPRRITVVRNGVSPREFVATPLPNGEARIPILLYIGTLADWQGLDVLISAMPQILSERSVKLRVVGAGRSRQRKALAKQIRKLGLEEQISIEGAVPHHQVPSLIAQADVCLAPLGLNDRNLTQGCCPIKIIEYMACGRPLVATNLPVVRELAREDVDALLFAPNDKEDLVRQVLRVLSDRRLAESLASSAAESVRARFTWHHAQKKMLKVYDRLLSRS